MAPDALYNSQHNRRRTSATDYGTPLASWIIGLLRYSRSQLSASTETCPSLGVGRRSPLICECYPSDDPEIVRNTLGDVATEINATGLTLRSSSGCVMEDWESTFAGRVGVSSRPLTL